MVDSALCGVAVCEMCPRRCALGEGQVGACRARIAQGGKVVSSNYGRVAAIALDPVEKKPFAGFMPGSKVLSVGSYGCNFSCPFCQNASIAQAGSEDVAWRRLSPEELIAEACRLREHGNIGVAYTYNEPLVGFEWVMDCARLAKEAGLKNLVVSNGSILEDPLLELLPYIDAVNIDVKGPDQGFYDMVGGDWGTVRRSVELAASCETCHLEVTTLVIPGLNDEEEGIASIACWLAGIDESIHLHLTRFFPCHCMLDRPATSVPTVLRLAQTAGRYLPNVHVGNC